MPTQFTEENLYDPVAKYMRREVATIGLDQTVGQALESMRGNAPAHRIIYFYVIDKEERLQGVVPTRRLLFSAPDCPVRDIMVRQVIALPAHATVLEACEFFTLHKLLAFPVIDHEHKLMGAIDVELYTDELTETSGMSDDLFQMIGVHLAKARQLSVAAAVGSRFPWLLCNMTGGLIAAFLSRLFEAELREVITLAMFIPVVLALAEGISIQSLGITLQILHGQPPTWAAIFGKLRRELVTGLFLGLGSGILIALVAILWLGQFKLALCLLGGIGLGMTGAAVMGVAVPNLLRLLRRNPQVAAGPLVLALADIFTLLIYFNLARWLLA